MPRQRRKTGSDATLPPKSSAIISSDATKTTPEMATVSESVKTGATVSLTDSEIATLAYQLWLGRGCPVGSDQEDWFRAEEMLENALLEEREDQLRLPSILSSDTSAESEMLADFPWNGHWEVWEREWGSARWVWDCA